MGVGIPLIRMVGGEGAEDIRRMIPPISPLPARVKITLENLEEEILNQKAHLKPVIIVGIKIVT